MSKVFKITTLVCVVLAVAGCESSEETHMRKCQAWGAPYGSPNFVQCMAIMAKNEQLQDQVDSASIMAGTSVGLAAGRR